MRRTFYHGVLRSITEPFFVNDQRLKIDSVLLCVLCGEFRHTPSIPSEKKVLNRLFYHFFLF